MTRIRDTRNRLSDYVNRKERGVFTAQAFTSKEKLAEYAAKHEIDVLLSGGADGFRGYLRNSVRTEDLYVGGNRTADGIRERNL